MKLRGGRCWKLCLLASALVLGCTGGAERAALVSGPMLAQQQGVAGASETAPPQRRFRQPAPPTAPMARRSTDDLGVKTSVAGDVVFASPRAPGAPVAALRPPVDADAVTTAAVNRNSSPPVAAVRGSIEPIVPVPATADGTYGHGTDYSWVQGKVDRVYTGAIKLRYCEASQDDRWGGGVFLVGSQTQQLREGTIVRAEGRLIPNTAGQGRQGPYSYPSYQVDRLTIVQPADSAGRQ